jgi:hypothetical protein
MQITFQQSYAWKIIEQHSPRLRYLDMVCFTLETDTYVNEVRSLVAVLFRQ